MNYNDMLTPEALKLGFTLTYTEDNSYCLCKDARVVFVACYLNLIYSFIDGWICAEAARVYDL